MRVESRDRKQYIVFGKRDSKKNLVLSLPKDLPEVVKKDLPRVIEFETRCERLGIVTFTHDIDLEKYAKYFIAENKDSWRVLRTNIKVK